MLLMTVFDRVGIVSSRNYADVLTCEWRRVTRERRRSSLLLINCPWVWNVSQEPRSYSWSRPGTAPPGSPVRGKPGITRPGILTAGIRHARRYGFLEIRRGIHLSAAVARECFVDLVDVGGDGLETGVEAIEPLLLDLLERLLGFLRSLPSGLEFWNRDSVR